EFKLGDAPVIVSVARLAPNRGHDLLLQGFRLLLRELPAARLLLVGKGETRGHLEQLVAELGLVNQVVFTGYRDRDLPLVLGAAGRQRAQDVFSPERSIDTVERVYRSLV